MGRPKVEKKERACLVCGKTFWIGGVDGKKASQKTCSLSCSTSRARKDRQEVQTLSKLTAAYIAGYVDADGSMGIYDRRPQLTVASTTLRLLHWIQRQVGAGSVNDMRHNDPRRKVSYQWYLSGRAVGDLLVQLHPFFRVKEHHSLLIQEYIMEMREHASDWNWNWQVYPAKLKVLNKKGPWTPEEVELMAAW